MTTDNEGVRMIVGAALDGAPPPPVLTGLTFATPDALTAVAPGGGGIEGCLASVCRDLALDFVFVSASAPWAEACTREVRACGCAVFWVVDGPLWPVLTRTGITAGLLASVRDPGSLDAALDRETVRARSQLGRGLALDVDVVVIAEDLATHQGPLVTPDFASRAVFSRLATLVGAATASRRHVVLHSDGELTELLHLVKQVGFSAVHAGAMTREAFEELFWASRRLGLGIVGGLFTRELERGRRAVISAGTRAALLAQAGGLLIADDGGIVTGDQLASFAGALAAARGKV